MKVKIARGVPGAGKSTWVLKNMLPGDEIVSADHFFMVDGAYKFDFNKLGEAHSQCLRKYVELCQSGGDITVYVDNTNLTVAEIAPYYQIAVAFGHDVEIVTIGTKPDVAGGRNVHGVPQPKVDALYYVMVREQKSFPARWKRSEI